MQRSIVLVSFMSEVELSVLSLRLTLMANAVLRLAESYLQLHRENMGGSQIKGGKI